MGNKSHIQINLDQPSDYPIHEDDLFLEQFAEYYLPTYYPISQLACFHLPTAPEGAAKISSKISHGGDTPFRFRVHSSADGMCLELTSTEGPQAKPIFFVQHSSVFDAVFLASLNAAISKILAQQSTDYERLQIEERFCRAQQRLAEEMMRQLVEHQRRWMRECAEQRLAARRLEKREREKDDIKKEEEKKQEMRLAIQKVEEPKRQSQRLCIQHEEATAACARTCPHLKMNA